MKTENRQPTAESTLTPALSPQGRGGKIKVTRALACGVLLFIGVAVALAAVGANEAPLTSVSLVANNTLTLRRFVKLVATNDAKCDAISATTDTPIGYVLDGYSSGATATVYTNGIADIECNSNIVGSNYLTTDSVGRVVPITGIGRETFVGQAMETVSSGQYCLTRIGYGVSYGPPALIAKTGNYTLVVGTDLSGNAYTNLGAGGTITLSLPAAPPAGLRYTFTRVAAQAFRVDPGASDGIYSGGAKKGDGLYIELAAIGDTVTLVADSAGDWVTVSQFGTLTYE